MKTMTLPKPRGFRLAAATEFYAGFTPGSGMAAASCDHLPDRLVLAFRLDRSFEAVAVGLHEASDAIVLEWRGTSDAATLKTQVARMLGLDADGDAWLRIGEIDPIVGRLQARSPGFFTAAKASPYDAAAWGVISPRMSVAQAAKVKMAIAREHGDAVELFGQSHAIFPSPEQVLAIERVAGLPEEKLVRLKHVARAAIDGVLDAERLRAMNEVDALAELQTIRGVGPWTASHILYRGCASRDGVPSAEPRVLHALAEAYGLERASEALFAKLSERWKPFRMWVCILLMHNLSRAGKWSQPDLASERAAAGRKLRGVIREQRAG